MNGVIRILAFRTLRMLGERREAVFLVYGFLVVRFFLTRQMKESERSDPVNRFCGGELCKLIRFAFLYFFSSDTSGMPDGKLGPMDPTNPMLYEFVRNLFSEIVQVFPDQYLHLGGDEVPFDCWSSNPDIVEYMKLHGMADRYELLENEYVAKVLAISDSLDANTIVWQEVRVVARSLLSFSFNSLDSTLLNNARS